MLRAQASATLKGNGWMGPMTFTQNTVILNDSWNAEDATGARDRVRALVPAGALDGVGKLLGTFGEIPGVKELKYFKHDSGRGVFGYVDMEPLPESETDNLRDLKPYEGD